jgi:hypothetical protein
LDHNFMSSFHRCRWILLLLIMASAAGCRTESTPTSAAVPGELSDEAQVRTADFAVLFVGNSHTHMHGLPGLVGDMIRFRHHDKSYYSHVVAVGFLEDVARNPRCREEIETRAWKHVVLQAQKESKSGNFQYSQTEGIDFAKLARSNGAKVTFFAEWGLREVPGHGPRIEHVYREMAAASGADVAPVGRAWDLALAARPELPLYSSDGNHQSAIGAFLTASVLYGKLTGERPINLDSFPYEGLDANVRKTLLEAADKALTASK